MDDRDTIISDTAIRRDAAVPQKERLSVVIVDSGMGGLSICASIVAGLEKLRLKGSFALTYFNAWPEQDRGYNSIADQAERIRVFDAALLGIRNYQPDIILIACNTLSVLYPQTAASRTMTLPVVGIVDFGVELMLRHMLQRPEHQVIILGTLTTISSAIHRDSLIAHGIDGRRIVSQACDQLATQIEYGPDSPQVRAMIDDFMVQAASKLHYPEAPVAAAFCCTHFGYCTDLFKHSLETVLGLHCMILNPNEAMGHYFIERFGQTGTSDALLRLEVVSRIQWEDRKVDAISAALMPTSPATARALRNYRYHPELFSF